MILNQKLFECISADAQATMVDQVTIGLGYTAVTTSDGGIGLAATGIAPQDSCAGSLDVQDYEQRPVIDLLGCIQGTDPMTRAMGLAAVNALSHRRSQQFPSDPGNTILFDRFKILSGVRVAMVGYFPPLVRLLQEKRVPLTVIDEARGIGDTKVFYEQLRGWAEVLLMTATSIINNTTETILSHAGPDLKTILLGPSTPMVPDAFDHLPIHMLAGTAITDGQQALKIVRHGGGARALRPVSHKIYWLAGLAPGAD